MTNTASTEAHTSEIVRGTHADFVNFYDYYLELIYGPEADERIGSGRWRLMRSVATEISARGAGKVLDCAAGTGFPAVDLAADPRRGLTIHCTDGDRMMLNVLVNRARFLDVAPERLLYPRKKFPRRVNAKAMTLGWDALRSIYDDYDYVLCRGNSLAYADSWIDDDVKNVAPLDRVASYLRKIAYKVRPGGYLHVDAPWTCGLGEREYRSVAFGGYAIWEQVAPERDCRRWELSYKFADGPTYRFTRYSSSLTVDVLQSMLDELGFEDTEPFPLSGDRESYGTIIARRPRR